jgi:hypothetical protein
MARRRAVGLAAAIAAGAATVTLLTPGSAVGRHSGGVPHEPKEKKIAICHEGKTIKVYPDDLDEHFGHDDTFGSCPKA